MKKIIRKVTMFVCLCAILYLLSGFISHEKENDLKLRNIEVLSRGEDGAIRKCIEDDGYCFDNDGVVHAGMRVNPKK